MAVGVDAHEPAQLRSLRLHDDRGVLSGGVRLTGVRRVMGRAIPVLLLLSVLPCAAHAQVDDETEARSLFEAGAEAFSNGRFERALEYFERSYELSGRPGLLFNIGTVADRLRLDARALTAFEAYLEVEPDAPNAVAVRARIDALRRAIAERENTLLWVLVGASSAFVLTGIGLLIGSEVDAASVRNAGEGTRWNDVASAYERAPILGAAGWITLAVGAIGAGLGGALLLAGSGPEGRVAGGWSMRAGLGGLELNVSF